jgi:hypothetical protein
VATAAGIGAFPPFRLQGRSVEGRATGNQLQAMPIELVTIAKRAGGIQPE